MTTSLERQLGTDAAEIIKLHREINKQGASVLDNAIHAGQLLCGIKDSLDHGDWLPWCEASLPEISERSIRNYMVCYKNRDALKVAQIQDLTKAYKAISPPKTAKPKSANVADLPADSVVNNAIPPGNPRDSGPPKNAPLKPVPPPEILDKIGYPIPQPSPALDSWNRASEVNELLTGLSRIKSAMAKAQDTRDKMYAEVNFAAIIADLKSSYELLKVALPFAVCPSCQGRVLSPCSTCGGRGMVSEFYWKHKVAKEVKEIRERAVKLRRESK